MKRLASIVVALMAAGTAASVVPTASAATDPVCRGERATIVGAPGRTVAGTPRRDVIVSNGAIFVRALGGDDVICLTDVRRDTTVFADDPDGDPTGNDTVVVQGASRNVSVSVYLLAGDDTFVGGRERDFVRRGGEGEFLYSGGDDVVHTGSGDDEVDLGWGDSNVGLDGTDRVDLGAGDDILHIRAYGLAQARSLVGGPGRDTVVLPADDRRVVIDNARLRMSRGSETFHGQRGFERYLVPSAGAIAFTGSDRADELDVLAARSVHATTGDGDDVVRAARTFHGRLVATGGRGDDRLIGSSGDDRLIGGPGRDVADGGRGRDTCGAERTTRCERQPATARRSATASRSTRSFIGSPEWPLTQRNDTSVREL